MRNLSAYFRGNRGAALEMAEGETLVARNNDGCHIGVVDIGLAQLSLLGFQQFCNLEEDVPTSHSRHLCPRRERSSCAFDRTVTEYKNRSTVEP